MVNVTHYNNDRASRLQVLGVVLGVVHNLLLYGDNYLLLDFRAHFAYHYLGGIIIDNLINSRHHSKLHEHLYNLRRGLFKSCGKLAYGNLVTHGYGYRRLLYALKLHTPDLIRLGLTLRSLRAAVILRFLLDFLLSRIIVLHCVGGGNYFVFFVIFIYIDIRCPCIDPAYFGWSAFRRLARLFIRLS